MSKQPKIKPICIPGLKTTTVSHGAVRQWTNHTHHFKATTQKKIQLTHSPHIPAYCVCPCLHACFPPSCCITEVCLHARSEDPAVCACVFAILLGCLPLFARMNANLAEFLMARDAVVSKIFLPPSLPSLPPFLVFCNLLRQTLPCSWLLPRHSPE